MNRVVKRVALGFSAALLLAAFGGGAFVWSQVNAVDQSLAKVYSVPVSPLKVEASPELLARGEHLARSIGGCAMGDCHGSDLAGGRSVQAGPLGTFTGPNITPAGVAQAYSDGELARLIEHGLKKDGRSVRFMTSHEVNWLPSNDVQAIVAYVRSVAPVEKANGPMEIGVMAKLLDGQDLFVLDVARRIDHSKKETVPSPEPTAAYGALIARLCVGCHGSGYSGGAIPGGPPDMAVPTNLTPHESGMKNYSYEDFVRLIDTGVKKDGEKLDAFMPIEALAHMDETERQALWAFLRSLPATEFGQR